MFFFKNLKINNTNRNSDRGMRKRRPFASIPEQHIVLNKIVRELNKIEMPVLSEDQQE